MQKSINLFNFSKIKSEHSFQISECNSFKYNFSKGDLSHNENNVTKNNNKKINMFIPSNNKIKEEKFKNDFFLNYNNSFANFCGINKKLFSEIYEKNQYIPVINQMGDIKVYIDNITKYLNEFSDLKSLKIKRNFSNNNKKVKIKNTSNKFMINKFRKLFKISMNKNNNSNNISIEENNDKEKNKREDSFDIIINNENSKNNGVNIKNGDKTLLNIKRKIKDKFTTNDNLE